MVYFVSTKQLVGEMTRLITLSTIDKFKEWLQRQDPILGIDTETTNLFDLTAGILSLQIGNIHDQWVFDFPTLTANDKQWLNDHLFYNCGKLKVFHHAKFDYKFLKKEGIKVRNLYCTLNSERLIYAGLKKPKGYYGLDEVAYRYEGVMLDKTVRGKIHRLGLVSEVILYGADDVKFLPSIRSKQMETLKSYALANDDCQDEFTVVGLENKATVVFADQIEYEGMIWVDPVKWQEVTDEVYTSLMEVKSELNKIVNETPVLARNFGTSKDLFGELSSGVNWASPKQKLKLMQLLVGDEISSVDTRSLGRYKKDHPIVDVLLRYSSFYKLYTSFANTLLKTVNRITGRIHPQINQLLATGRISCSNPNLLQIPARTDIGQKMRKCFRAKPGYKIVGGDYSGMELRIIAEFSQDPLWCKTFKEGGDLHSILCAKTFNIDISEVKNKSGVNPEISYRDIQKTIDFGLAYGMSSFKLADVMRVKERVAKSTIDRFFEVVPKVKHFLDNAGNMAKRRGYIRTAPPYGRLRFFDGYQNRSDGKTQGAIERKGKNTIPQGTNGDIIKLALVRMFDFIQENQIDVTIRASVYDEIQTECHESIAEWWKVEMDRIMVEAAATVIKTIPVEVDCGISDHWSK